MRSTAVLNQPITLLGVTVTLSGFTIEEAVKEDGSSDGHSVLVTLTLSRAGQAEAWNLLLPADSARALRETPERYRKTFAGAQLSLVDLNPDPQAPTVTLTAAAAP